MLRLLTLDAALGPSSAAIVLDGEVAAHRSGALARGQSALLAPMVAEILAEAGLDAVALDFVAVTVGPGSFTGLRASLALAHGIALAAGVAVVGVTVAEVLAEALPHLAGRALWTAVDSRRDRIFLHGHFDAGFQAVQLTALPSARGRVAVAGDAAIAVAARLAARGDDVWLTDARAILPHHIALAAQRRVRGALPPLAAQPLYIDPPEARLPAGGLRPAPAA